MNASLVFFIGKKLAHFVKEFEAYSPEVGELDPETETRDAVIRNPLCPDDDTAALYIEFGEEFTIYYRGWHMHFSAEDFWYDFMVKYLHDILEDRTLIACVTDASGKTLAAGSFDSDKSPSSASDIFSVTLPAESAVCTVYGWTRERFELPIK